MRDAEGQIRYVGKAVNLRSRLRQYFGSSRDPRPFVATLARWLSAVEVIVTASEREALLLERELILEHQPRHNVALRFDRGQLLLRIDPRAPWPRVTVSRRRRKDGALYFGPYSSGRDLRALQQLIDRAFLLRTCEDSAFKNRSRPCLQYQIKRCLGPCVLPVSEARYRQEVDALQLFLGGQRRALEEQLEAKMRAASAALEFEEAGRYRDQLAALRRQLEPQGVVALGDDKDVFGLYREGALVQLTRLEIRGGVLRRAEHFELDEQGADSATLLGTFLSLFYHRRGQLPPELLLPLSPPGREVLEGELRALRGGALQLRCPRRGTPLRLIELAAENAEHAFFQGQRAETLRREGLEEIQRLLRLRQRPARIECFDISIFHGEAPYASQVLFEEGLPRRRAYRARRITEVSGTDDFAMLREALQARLREGEADALPQLLLIDGGKGQLAVAVTVLKELGLDAIEVASIAKSRVERGGSEPKRSPERIFRPGLREAIPLRPGSNSFALLTQLRDEAHRVAIEAHRRARRRARLRSSLDQIPGVGPRRRQALLRGLGSLRAVRAASREELSAVAGISAALAARIYEYFHPSGEHKPVSQSRG